MYDMTSQHSHIYYTKYQKAKCYWNFQQLLFNNAGYSCQISAVLLSEAQKDSASILFYSIMSPLVPIILSLSSPH